MAEFPTIVARNYSELVDALARVKNFLQLSNETVEAVGGLVKGHCDKLLGPSRSKKIGPQSLDLLLGALAIELVVRPNPDAAAKVASRWEKRNTKQVRHTVSQAMIDRVRPIILAELGIGAGYKG
jgi:hypothetical protein